MPRIRWLLAVVFLGLAIALVCLRVDPLPAPESDPGPLPVDDPPIVVPPIPASGPVGPGFRAAPTLANVRISNR